jgi:peptidoglycan/xylan/chitin deacetylase (PgdA/CDA1 family)
VINQSSYFLFILDVALDKTRRRELFWNGSCSPMNSYKEKLGLRNELKNYILKLTTESERMEFVQRLAIDLDVPDFSMPEHLRVLCIEQILILRDMGVSIANHGWTHGAIEAMDPSAVRDEIVKTKKWIAQTCGAAPSAYAVPFGNALPPFEISDDVCGTWLLFNFDITPGFVAPNVFNRETLDVRA